MMFFYDYYDIQVVIIHFETRGLLRKYNVRFPFRLQIFSSNMRYFPMISENVLNI